MKVKMKIIHAWLAGLALCFAATTSFAQQPAAESSDIKAFARQLFMEGVPFDVASEFSSDEIPPLLEMLNDPEEMPYWANVVVILEMIGNAEVFDRIINFIETANNQSTVLPRDHYIALTSAISGLGYLYHQSQDRRVLRYLQAGTDPDFWQAKKSLGRSAFHATPEVFHTDLSKYCLIGLALSGSDEGAETLRNIQQPSTKASGQRLRAKYSELAKDALEANETIRTHGLLNYYAR